MLLSIYYANSTLCDIDKLNEDYQPPYGLLVDPSKDNQCIFVSQAHRAQQLGATAVIFANHRCLCSDVNCTSTSTETICESKPPIVKDDGSGQDVSIPSVLISKSDADPLKKYLQQEGSTLIIELQWRPFRSKVVSLDFWHTPCSTLRMDLWKIRVERNCGENFTDIYMALGDSFEFTPHFLLLNGKQIGCFRNPECEEICTNHGRYCGLSDSKQSNKICFVSLKINEISL
jgi:hypothetical protein